MLAAAKVARCGSTRGMVGAFACAPSADSRSNSKRPTNDKGTIRAERLGGEQCPQVDAGVEDVLPQVASLGQALGHVQQVELRRIGVLELFPAQRRRNARPGDRAR